MMTPKHLPRYLATITVLLAAFGFVGGRASDEWRKPSTGGPPRAERVVVGGTGGGDVAHGATWRPQAQRKVIATPSSRPQSDGDNYQDGLSTGVPCSSSQVALFVSTTLDASALKDILTNIGTKLTQCYRKTQQAITRDLAWNVTNQLFRRNASSYSYTTVKSTSLQPNLPSANSTDIPANGLVLSFQTFSLSNLKALKMECSEIDDADHIVNVACSLSGTQIEKQPIPSGKLISQLLGIPDLLQSLSQKHDFNANNTKFKLLPVKELCNSFYTHSSPPMLHPAGQQPSGWENTFNLSLVCRKCFPLPSPVTPWFKHWSLQKLLIVACPSVSVGVAMTALIIQVLRWKCSKQHPSTKPKTVVESGSGYASGLDSDNSDSESERRVVKRSRTPKSRQSKRKDRRQRHLSPVNSVAVMCDRRTTNDSVSAPLVSQTDVESNTCSDNDSGECAGTSNPSPVDDVLQAERDIASSFGSATLDHVPDEVPDKVQRVCLHMDWFLEDLLPDKLITGEQYSRIMAERHIQGDRAGLHLMSEIIKSDRKARQLIRVARELKAYDTTDLSDSQSIPQVEQVTSPAVDPELNRAKSPSILERLSTPEPKRTTAQHRDQCTAKQICMKLDFHLEALVNLKIISVDQFAWIFDLRKAQGSREAMERLFKVVKKNEKLDELMKLRKNGAFPTPESTPMNSPDAEVMANGGRHSSKSPVLRQVRSALNLVPRPLSPLVTNTDKSVDGLPTQKIRSQSQL
ncbi:uncharacterized protein LOC135827601 [Sycon ciliatum]|uniref:uncharacterized protein LOC135827601 n=1 Tax=Sycon ciliatum TaxID=27933 RepID=UPI0020AAACC5